VIRDPDASVWAREIRSLLADAAGRRDLVGRGERQAARYTWEETAQRTWEVYRQVGA
jgi:glycosyltransferase involved in cell wall biosynthesis